MHFVHQRIVNLVKLVIVTQAVLWHGLSFSQTWRQVGQGLSCTGDGGVNELFADTIHDMLLGRGGLGFDGDCDTLRNAVAYNGEEWLRLGNPLESTAGYSVGVFNGEIVSAGIFYPGFQNMFVNNIAIWNNTTWDTIPQGPNDPGTFTIEQFGAWLYIAGTFTKCGGDSTKLVCRWNGQEWDKLINYYGEGEFGLALAMYKDTLYLGGGYYGNEEQTGRANCLSAIYNLEPHQVGVGLTRNSIVEALCVHNDTLWIGGTFPEGNFEEYPINSYLLTYANGELKPYHSQPNIRITALKSYQGNLYIGGWFQGEDEEPAWDGCMNVALLHQGQIYCLNYGEFVNGQLRDIEVWKDTLYVAGDMWAIGDTLVRNVAYLDWPLKDIYTLLGIEPPTIPPTITQLTIYPNPAFNNITVASPDTIHSIEIFDITGRVIFTYKPETTKATLDISSLAAGCYLCNIRMVNGQQVTRRIVRQE